MAPLPEELGVHGLNRTDQSQSYPKLRKSDLWRRTHGVAPPTLPLDVERTKTVRSGPSGSALHTELHAQARVAVPPTLPLDVERTETVRSGPSGSADHARLHAQARVAVPPTLPLDVKRTETVRPGPSGSANHMELHAQGRVAAPPTLPLDVERTGCTPSHCHSTSNVPKMSRWLPMTSRTRRRWPSRARCPVTPASRGP